MDFVALIADAFPDRFKATPSVARLWAAMLADLPVEDARGALMEHLAESSFVPAIADIRTRVARKRVNAPDFAAALSEVMRGVRYGGRYKMPEWSHPAIASAVEALGWNAICDSPTEGTNTLRAQFERAYQAVVTTERSRANVGALEEHRARVGQLSAGDAIAGLLSKGGKP
jgi:hypothetical protein